MQKCTGAFLLPKVVREMEEKKQVPSKYHVKYPANPERDYIRLTNIIMHALKEVIEDNAGSLKVAIGDGTRFDSAKDNEKARKAMRMTAFSRTSQNIEAVFNQMRKELNTKFGFFDAHKSLVAISQRTQKLSISEFKRACKQTIGLDLRDDFFTGELYDLYMREWVSDNVELIKTIPFDSLDDMKQIVFSGYVDGKTTTSIMQQIQHKYKTTKSYARFVARDQTAKLNGQITKMQHEKAGVSSYVWDDSGDGRVRKRHHQLNGHTFSWDNSNPARNDKGQVITPGSEYRCRCVSLPVFDVEKLPVEAIQTK